MGCQWHTAQVSTLPCFDRALLLILPPLAIFKLLSGALWSIATLACLPNYSEAASIYGVLRWNKEYSSMWVVICDFGNLKLRVSLECLLTNAYFRRFSVLFSFHLKVFIWVNTLDDASLQIQTSEALHFSSDKQAFCLNPLSIPRLSSGLYTTHYSCPPPDA